MSVRPARGQVRPTAAAKSTYRQHSFPAPSLGWVSNVNIATGAPGAAYRLDNFFPTPAGAVLRRGCLLQASLSGPVMSLIPYVAGNTARLFASSNGGIWDVTGGTPAEVHAINNGRVSTANYVSTDGVLFVRGVNGTDTPWVYDGDSFKTTPALTFPDGDSTAPSDLAFVWVFKERFWFIRKDSLDAYYLPVGSLGGALVRFSLGGLVREGGSLVWGASWSQETGNGLSVMCVFATDMGEVVVFSGNNPGSASDWTRVGTYTIGKPLGPEAVIYRGGDLAICTDVGLISLSQALLRDTEAISPTAMSRPIETDWMQYAAERYERRWSATVWTEGQMLVVAPPTVSGTAPVWLVSNATTGKWSRFTGWNANCLAVFNGELYFGSPDGGVYQANVTGADNGAPYVGTYLPLFDQIMPGLKSVHMARATMRSRLATRERLSAHLDYGVDLPPAPQASSGTDADVWGVAQWGSAKWGDPRAGKIVQGRWKNMFGAGEAVTIGHQVTSASVAPLDLEIVRTDVLFTVGEVQT